MKTLNKVINYSPMTASQDGLLDANPDRGYRTEFVFRIEETAKAGVNYDWRTVFADRSEEEIKETFNKIFELYFPEDTDPVNNLFLVYVYLTAYYKSDISASALDVLEIFFKMCRERKVKSMLRFCYNWSYAKDYRVSDENKQKLASECADQDTILKHIQQLKPVISEHADTIHTISNGFVGYVGEWAKPYQYPVVDYPTVMKAIVENLCVPNGLFFSNREPAYKNELILADPSYKYLGYISHNNDAMYGEQANKDWYSGDYQLGRPEWQQVIDEGAYTPQDGEMFTLSAVIETTFGRTYNPRVPTGLQMILECAHHRHTSMSNWHCYLEAMDPNGRLYNDNIMLNWQKRENVIPELLDFNRVIFDPNWFVDDEGKKVLRNPYQFIRDHLGYRLVAQEATVGISDNISVELKLKNFGFAAAFNLESGFAILDEKGDVISEVKAGEPHKWYSHDPENYLSTEVLEHTVSAELGGVSEKGTYYVAFYLRNTMGIYAALSNKVERLNGYNILYTFEV